MNGALIVIINGVLGGYNFSVRGLRKYRQVISILKGILVGVVIRITL